MRPASISVDTDLLSTLDEVRDQGQRPTCLAFASTTAHELARIARRGFREDLSEEHLFWVATGAGPHSADGISFSEVAAVLHDPGQATAAVAPYDLLAPDGDYELADAASENLNLRRAGFSPINTAASDIESAIDGGQAVVVGLELWPEFFTPTAGAVSNPPAGSPSLGLHAVVLVGYDAREQRFLLRNSWGRGWGDGGYALISYNAIGSTASEAWVAEDALDGYP